MVIIFSFFLNKFILLKNAYLGLYTKQQIFEDVKAALDLWLNISHLNHFEEGDCSALSDNIMILLYNVVDLLQLKVRFPLIILVSVVFV